MYHAEKQNDGTYTIKWSEFGGNSEIVQTDVRGCNVRREIDGLYALDMAEPQCGEKVLELSGVQSLERTHDGRIVVTDGWLTDWIVFYDHKPEWAHDGTLAINRKIRDRLDRMARARIFG